MVVSAKILAAKAAEKTGNIFKIVCEGSHKASELVRRGKYDRVNALITDKRFPISKHAQRPRTIELVEFIYDPDSEESEDVIIESEDALIEIERRGLEAPTTEDAFYFGIQYPDEQRKHPIVFLHGLVEHHRGFRYVLVLRTCAGGRYLSLYWFRNWWHRRYVFAGVCT